jgi:hypothetical protein
MLSQCNVSFSVQCSFFRNFEKRPLFHMQLIFSLVQ